MFDGNLAGNILGVIYYMVFQITGCLMMNRVLAKECLSIIFRLLIGSITGTLALQWCPILFAFSFGFTIAAHIMGMCLWIFIFMVAWYLTEASPADKQHPYRTWKGWYRLIKENPCIILMAVLFIYFAYCLMTHTIPANRDGSFHTGQSTYGDMNMHLGFITSIINQKSFPPEYSIYPGVRLAYPFLSDSISSSLYIWGASLRVAYVIPMLIAICQVMGGFYCFIKYWFGRSSTALIAWLMFFLDGGLGFVYFTNPENLIRNFSDFYYTPTSIGDMNFRWTQIIANMLIPQRATLFGWAVLFPLLAFFLYAVRKHSRLCFVIAGIFAGALPMIHTHSFLGFGLVCTMWLLFDSKRISHEMSKNQTHNQEEFYAAPKNVHTVSCGNKPYALLASLPIGLLFFSILQIANKKEDMVSKNGMLIMGVGVGLLLLVLFVVIIQVIRQKQWKTLIATWGIFLGIIIVLALPQLLIWTFGQAGSEGFVRGHFNWSNTGDQYLWFYVKNIGVTFVLFILAFFCARKQNLQIASPLLLIWFIAELVVFQPNEYDNNKLLFVGFVFMCGLAADFTVTFFVKKWNRILKAGVAAILLFFGTISAILTLGREWVSDYELYSASSVEACKFIEEMTEPESVILTASNHNNPVASLTGRNIVCGSGTFLYYHGIDYSAREAELSLMYSDPVTYYDRYQAYHVDYIYISGMEMSSYSVNMDGIQQIADCVYAKDDVQIYELRDSKKSYELTLDIPSLSVLKYSTKR